MKSHSSSDFKLNVYVGKSLRRTARCLWRFRSAVYGSRSLWVEIFGVLHQRIDASLSKFSLYHQNIFKACSNWYSNLATYWIIDSSWSPTFLQLITSCQPTANISFRFTAFTTTREFIRIRILLIRNDFHWNSPQGDIRSLSFRLAPALETALASSHLNILSS